MDSGALDALVPCLEVSDARVSLSRLVDKQEVPCDDLCTTSPLRSGLQLDCAWKTRRGACGSHRQAQRTFLCAFISPCAGAADLHMLYSDHFLCLCPKQPFSIEQLPMSHSSLFSKHCLYQEFDPTVKEAAAWAIGYIAQHTAGERASCGGSVSQTWQEQSCVSEIFVPNQSSARAMGRPVVDIAARFFRCSPSGRCEYFTVHAVKSDARVLAHLFSPVHPRRRSLRFYSVPVHSPQPSAPASLLLRRNATRAPMNHGPRAPSPFNRSIDQPTNQTWRRTFWTREPFLCWCCASRSPR